MLEPIAEGPFYAIELSPSMLNTQGGPRRNEKAQIVRPDGTPIPRLYSAGELGSIYSYLYRAPAISANAWRSAGSRGETRPRKRLGVAFAPQLEVCPRRLGYIQSGWDRRAAPCRGCAMWSYERRRTAGE